MKFTCKQILDAAGVGSRPPNAADRIVAELAEAYATRGEQGAQEALAAHHVMPNIVYVVATGRFRDALTKLRDIACHSSM